MTMPSILEIVVLVACLALSFLLSGMEAGVFALSRLRIRQQRRTGRYAARVLQKHLDSSEDFLWTILIGNTLATFAVFSLLILALHDALDNHPFLFAGVFVLFAILFYALCDLLPKMLFRQFPNRLCLLAAVPFQVIDVALGPLADLVAWFSARLAGLAGVRNAGGAGFGTRGELRWMTRESAENLSSEERVMIGRVLDLQNQVLGSITTPLNKTPSLSSGASAAEFIRLARESGIDRLPVWEEGGGARRIAGVASLRDFLYEPGLDVSLPIRGRIRQALFLDENFPIDEAFRRMQSRGHRLAIVLGPGRREAGVVRIEDILKAIFGEVRL